MSDKTSLRQKYKQLRTELSVQAREEASLAIANQALELPIWEKSVFHLFLPIERHAEVNTEYLLQILMGRDKAVALSKSDFQNVRMQHFLLTDETKIAISAFGIPEPQNGAEIPLNAINVVFVPLLAFDVSGHRIGYGKGFYDRFLAECEPDVVKVGLSLFEAEPQITGILPNDVRLDFCVTPRRIYAF